VCFYVPQPRAKRNVKSPTPSEEDVRPVACRSHCQRAQFVMLEDELALDLKLDGWANTASLIK
jgi:hypothetical protein